MTIFQKILVVGCVALCAMNVETGCYYDHEDELYPVNQTCSDTTTAKYSTVVAPLMDNSCTGCHGGTSPSAGIKIDTYTSIKAYITSKRAEFLGCMYQTGSYSPMPKGGSKLPYCDVKKIERWIDAGMPNN
ncbi:MAG: hypothetical protein RL757_501 [Bacteroidota bacterium]|jgi:hypothetical protein